MARSIKKGPYIHHKLLAKIQKAVKPTKEKPEEETKTKKAIAAKKKAAAKPKAK